MKTIILTIATLLTISSLSFSKTASNETQDGNDNIDIYLNAFNKGSMPSVSDIVDTDSEYTSWIGTVITTENIKTYFNEDLDSDEQAIHTFDYAISLKKDEAPFLNRLSFFQPVLHNRLYIPHLKENTEYTESDLFFDTKAKILKTSRSLRQFRIYNGLLVFKDEANKDGLCNFYATNNLSSQNTLYTYVSKPALKKYKNLCSVGVLSKVKKD